MSKALYILQAECKHVLLPWSWTLLTHARLWLWLVQVREGLHYNPYFPGGAIAMPKMLVDEGTEYDDDSVFATESQQAKVGL